MLTLSVCVGLKGARCDEDEKLFNQILRLSKDPKKPLLILDARPQLNAVANTYDNAQRPLNDNRDVNTRSGSWARAPRK